MPIYEYACQKCGTQMEVMQKISDKPLIKHQDCGGKLEKQWSNTSFQLKGAGWYVTDYATKKPADKEIKTADGKDAPAASDSSATDATTGETASASKTDEKTKTVDKKASAKSESVKSDAKTSNASPTNDKK